MISCNLICSIINATFLGIFIIAITALTFTILITQRKKLIRQLSAGTMKNWADRIALSITAYAILHILLSPEKVRDALLYLSTSFNQLPSLIQLCVVFLFGYYLPIFLSKHHCRLPTTIDYATSTFQNPPIYFSALIVVAVTYHREFESLEINTCFLLAFISGLTSKGYGEKLLDFFKNNPKDKENSQTEKKQYISEDEISRENIDAWVEQEEPISNPEEDKLNLIIYKERIGNLFLKYPDRSHQITVIGEFGSGKSSLCNLIEKSLNELSNEYIFCRIDGWGREQKNCAGQILEIVIEKLAEHSDCSRLTETPANYVSALNSQLSNTLIPGLSIIGELFSPIQKSSPINQLHKIDKLLLSLNKKLIIVLEDFDRGSDEGNLPPELTSLIDRSKALTQLSFINTLTKVSKADDLSRITSHYEYLTTLNDDQVQSITRSFITKREKENPEIILPNHQGDNYKTPQSISELAPTVRLLKIALRRTKSAWESGLKGEIDIVDLLHFNILRHTSPGIESRLQEKFGDRYKVSNELPSDEKDSSPPTRPRSPKQIAEDNLTESLVSPTGLQIQTINNGKYLNRAISQHIPDSEPKDQETLQKIYSFTSNQIDRYLSEFSNEQLYSAHLSNLIRWTCAFEELAAKHMPKITDVIMKQSNQLFPKHKYPYVDLSDIKRNTEYSAKAYPLITTIAHLLLKQDHDSSSIYHDFKEKIITHLISSNASLAVYLADKFMPAETDRGYSRDILGILDAHFHKAQYKTLLDKIDSKNHIQSLVVLCNLYTITHIQNNQYTPYGLDEINRFHTYLTKSGFEITKNIIPSFVFHLDKYQDENKNPILENFNKKKIKEMIMSFELPEPIPHTHEKYIYNLINKWQLKIDSYITT